MMGETVQPESLVARLEAVRERLAALAASPPRSGLTSPDPKTSERWDWGQVWAHLGEFPGYWMRQIKAVADHEGPDSVPFGRVKTDPGRIAAIEADRNRPTSDLMKALDGQIKELLRLLSGLPEDAWGKRGVHSTLGVMNMARIVEEFVVGHLEDHAAQLHELASPLGD